MNISQRFCNFGLTDVNHYNMKYCIKNMLDNFINQNVLALE